MQSRSLFWHASLALLLLLAPSSLATAHGDGPACVDDTAVLSSDPSRCCPSEEYVLEADPRGSGPRCTRCRFDRYRCEDDRGGCCFADADCAINAAGWPVCVLAVDGAGLPSAPIESNRSGSDPRRDRLPSGTTAADGGGSFKLLASAILFVSALVGVVLLCDARRGANSGSAAEAEAVAVASVDEEAADLRRPSSPQSHTSILPRRKNRDADRNGTELERLTAEDDSQTAQLTGAAGSSDVSKLLDPIDDHLTLRLDEAADDEADPAESAALDSHTDSRPPVL